jgi:hypothetical protein
VVVVLVVVLVVDGVGGVVRGVGAGAGAGAGAEPGIGDGGGATAASRGEPGRCALSGTWGSSCSRTRECDPCVLLWSLWEHLQVPK